MSGVAVILFQSLASPAAEEAALGAIAGIFGQAIAAVRADGLQGPAAVTAKLIERDARPLASGAI